MHAGESPAATRAHLTSTIMEARITAYLALSTNPEPGPLPAGVFYGWPPTFLPTAKMAGRSKAHYSWHRRHGPTTAEKVHGRGQDAELFRFGPEGIVSSSYHQHSAAEPGGLVEPDHRHECGRTRHFRLHPSRSQDLAALFFGFASGTAQARNSFGQLGHSVGWRDGRAASPGESVLGNPGRLRRAQHNFSHAVEFSTRQGEGKHSVRHGHAGLARQLRNIFVLYRRPNDRGGSGGRRPDYSGPRGRLAGGRQADRPGQHFPQGISARTRAIHGFHRPAGGSRKVRRAGPGIRVARRRMERLDPRPVPIDSVYRERQGHLPLLSQAGASAISALCFADEHRPCRPRPAAFHAERATLAS